MRVAVSGADGFLGNQILLQLKSEGISDVVAITLEPDTVWARYPDWDGLDVVLAETTTLQSSPLLDGVDVYIGCAFPRAAGGVGMASGLDFVSMAYATLAKRGCRSIVNISSQSVYDQHREGPAHETDALVLDTPYATAKYAVELFVDHLCQEAGMPYAHVRLASLIGPRFDQRFVNKMAKAGIQSGEISVYEGSSRHAFLDVCDAAHGILELIGCERGLPNGPINIGPTRAYTNREIADTVASVIRSLTGTLPCVRVLAEETDTTCSALDMARFEGLTGWRASTPLSQSVRDICKAILEA